MSEQYYYADANRTAKGPYTAAQLKGLHSKGVVKDKTKIIQKGTKKWFPYSDLKVKAPATKVTPASRAKKPVTRPASTTKSFFGSVPKPVFFGILGALGCLVGAGAAEIALLLMPTASQAPPGKPNICLLIDTSLSMVASEQPASQNISILMDTSGSMANANKIRDVKSASIKFVHRAAEPNRKFAVFSFNSIAQTDQLLTSKPELIEAAINRFSPAGGTMLNLGLEETKKALSLGSSDPNKSQDIVMIFTDGQSSNPTADIPIAQLLRDQNVMIIAIHTPDANRNHLIQLTGKKELVIPTSAGNFEKAFDDALKIIEGIGKEADPSNIGPDSKITKVKNASIGFVERQKTNQLNIAVLRFGDDAEVMQGLSTNTAQITDSIKKLMPKGQTALHLGLQKVQSELPLENRDTVIDDKKQDSAQDFVVVFTDGEPDKPEEALKIAKQLRDKGVQIYSIHTADASGDFLQKLTGNNATRVISTTSNSIDEAFKGVENLIKPKKAGVVVSGGGAVDSLVRNGLWFALLAMALALALTMAQNKLTSGGGETRGLSSSQLFTALIIGGIAGFAAGGVNLLFGEISVNQFAVFAGRTLAWGLLAAVIGFAMIFVIANFTPSRAIVGGLIGGLVGGVIYNIILFGIVGESGSGVGKAIGRMLGAMVVGSMIGVFIAWIEQLTRKAWLTIYWTPNQHGTVNLGEKPVTIGGGKDDVRIKGLPERAMSISLSQGAVICTQQSGNRTQMKDQSAIKLGKVRLVVHAKNEE